MNNIFHIIVFLIKFSCLLANDNLSLLNNCGIFKLSGIVKKDSHHDLYIVLNNKSKDEIILSTPLQNKLKLLAYINHPFEGEFEIKKSSNGTLGQVSKILNMNFRINDVLGNNYDSIILIKKMDCSK